MTVEEIFNKLVSHMVEGIMIHDEMANAYDFLGLYGFAKLHDHHHVEETCNYRRLAHYFSTHYHKLLKVDTQVRQTIIPDTWYKYTTMAVDANTKRTAVKDLMTKWVGWEQDTKKLYQDMYVELHNLGEIAAAEEIKCYILCVSDELKYAEKKMIKLATIDYNINTIIGWQEALYKKFKH